MSNIRLKRSAVPNRIPTIDQVELGELVINSYDGKLFLKKDIDGQQSIVELGASNNGGSQGIQGTSGIQGIIGNSGSQGTQGISGAFVAQGIQGIQGATGISSASWGSISGTLSNQTDLNTALGLKSPLDNPIFTGTITAPIITNTSGSNFATTSGNVGIGTTSPRGKLDVTTTLVAVGTANDSIVFGSGIITYPTAPYGGYGGLVAKSATSDARLMIQDGNGRINNYWNAYSDAGGYKYIVSSEPAAREQIHVNTNGFWSFYGAPSGTSGSTVTFTQGAYIEPNLSVWFSPRGTSSDFYINNSGSVGIGTVSPSAKLHIAGTGYLTQLIQTSTTGSGAILSLSNTARSYSLGARGDFGSGMFNIVDETAGLARFSIFSNGNIGVGTVTDNGFKLDVSGSSRFIDVTCTSITETSSERYKENIHTLDNALDKVISLRGVQYNLKDNKIVEIGVIAEEIANILPEVIKYNNEGQPDSVSYGRLSAVFIEAIKQQQKQIELLKQEINLYIKNKL